jgi:Uma2 family endonuclease
MHRLDLETYDRMVACGALEDQRVELLEGVIVDMSPQSPSHAMVVEELTQRLSGTAARLRVQSPIAIPPDSEPEPDLALVAERPRANRHPQTALVVVEVTVSSHRIDRGTKSHLYARANVPVYWLIDVPARAVEVRMQPSHDGYGRCEIYHAGEHVPSPAAGVASLPVAALFDGLGS